MKNIVVSAIILGIVGLVAGYFLFGKIGNHYISLQNLIIPSESVLKQLGNTLIGVDEARRNILISGGVGAVFGIVVGIMRKR